MITLTHQIFRSKTVRNIFVILFLRLLAGTFQFLIIILLASKLSNEDFGIYTVFAIYINYLILLAGFNFHTYTTRELGTHERQHWPKLLMQNAKFLMVNGIMVIFIAIFIHYANLLNFNGLIFFLCILVFGSINNQIENFLLGAGYPIQSAVNILLRALWIGPLFLLNLVFDITLSLYIVFTFWLLSEMISVCYMINSLRKYKFLKVTGVKNHYNIIKGWSVGARYTFMGLLLTLAITMQRIILGETHSMENVGVFQFYYAMAVFLPNMIEAAVFAVLLPKLIRESLSEGLNKLLQPRYGISIILVITVMVCLYIVSLFLPQIILLVDKNNFSESKEIFTLICIYSILYFISRLFHYQLYSANKDVFLTYANIIVFSAAFISSIYLIPLFGITGAAYSLILSSFTMVLAYSFPFLFKHIKNDKKPI